MKQYFAQILNEKTGTNQEEFHEKSYRNKVPNKEFMNRLSKEEIEDLINLTKSKSPGKNGITKENMKSGDRNE